MDNQKQNQFQALQERSYNQNADGFVSFQKMISRNRFKKIKAVNEYLDIQNGDKVLEMGVGAGFNFEYLLKNNPDKKFDLIGIDISSAMLAKARERLSERENVKLIEMAGEKLEFPADFFDKVYTIDSLHHLFDPEAGLKELLRVLKPGGKFYLLEPSYFSLYNFLLRWFLPAEKNIRQMTKKNFINWLGREKVKFAVEGFGPRGVGVKGEKLF